MIAGEILKKFDRITVDARQGSSSSKTGILGATSNFKRLREGQKCYKKSVIKIGQNEVFYFNK